MLTRRLTPRRVSTIEQTGASGALRRRVLASVHDDDAEPATGFARDPRHRRAIAIATVVALLSLAGGALIADSPGTSHETTVLHGSLRLAGEHGELKVTGMAEPPIGEIYEVWLERRTGTPQPTDALFTVTNRGDATVEVPGSLRGVRAVMVTAEPLGGSSTPTSPTVLSVALTR
jgi:hypothetical protein